MLYNHDYRLPEAGEAIPFVVNEYEPVFDAPTFNAETGIYEDLVKAGVMTIKVNRFALQNAASVASLYDY